MGFITVFPLNLQEQSAACSVIHFLVRLAFHRVKKMQTQPCFPLFNSPNRWIESSTDFRTYYLFRHRTHVRFRSARRPYQYHRHSQCSASGLGVASASISPMAHLMASAYMVCIRGSSQLSGTWPRVE